MREIPRLAEQVRQQRRPASPDNPLLQLQMMVSERIIAALDAWRDLRNRTVEQMFLAIYSMPVLQAAVGIRASDESPRRQPGMEPERIAVIRGGVYIGMGGPDVDERAFNRLRQIRAEHGDLTPEEFKRMLREQFFALMRWR